jgi:transcriptional regulator with XRE-family HTH domain
MGTPKSATAMDRLIGQRIQIFRKSKAMSQAELGASLGVTFQQVQKYESGANRVGSARLVEIARVLEVPILKFFGEKKAKGERGVKKTVTDLLSESYAVEMLQAFAKIKNVDVRRKIVKLAAAIALKAEG